MMAAYALRPQRKNALNLCVATILPMLFAFQFSIATRIVVVVTSHVVFINGYFVDAAMLLLFKFADGDVCITVFY